MLDLHVRPASTGDVDAVLDLLAEAAAWTESRGYPNWPARFSSRLVAKNASAGELFVAEAGGGIVATLTLLWSDPMFWGDPDDGTAGYVHRLAVRREHAGAGAGYRLIDWADAQVRAHGRSFVRLDVVSSNAPLRRYYEHAGFVHRRDREGEFTRRDGTKHAWQTNLYERGCRPRAD